MNTLTMNNSAKETLHTLKEMHECPIDPAEDIRSRKIVDSKGETLGEIDALLVDDQQNKVRFVRVASGGFLGVGKKHALIPVDAITKITAHHVYVNQTREHLAGSPTYDPKLVDEAYFETLYGYYGYGPYWGSAYVYPLFPYY